MYGSRVARYAWSVLVFNIAVIVWGAFVRASGSGAGCGRHWPLCNGTVLPRAPRIETLVELTHRTTSGVALLLVVALAAWCWRAFPRRHPARVGAAAALFFILTEAGVGAGLVLLEMVARNQSLARVAWLSIHLVNTFLLVAALTLTAWWASGGGAVHLRSGGRARWALAAGLAGAIAVGVTGAIAALGDTLFPSASLADGFRNDFAPAAHLVLRLRVLHPVLAASVGLYLLVTATVLAARRSDHATRTLARLVGAAVLVQWAMGTANLLLLAPIWSQLTHLLLADVLWVALVLLSAAALSGAAAAVTPAPLRDAPAPALERR